MMKIISWRRGAVGASGAGARGLRGIDGCPWFSPLLLLLLCALPVGAGTYYIDNSTGSDNNAGTSTNAPWKCCPGMPAFQGSYTHSAGDRFIFRGGVTWDTNQLSDAAGDCFTYKWSGLPNAKDYLGTNANWFTGSSWTYPVFDLGNKSYTNTTLVYGIQIFCQSNFIIEGLRIQNTGLYGSGISVVDCVNLWIQNCYITPAGVTGVLVFNNTNTAGNWNICSNYMDNCARPVYASGSPYNTMSNVYIHDNSFGSQIVNAGDYHGDGIYVKGYSPGSTIPWTNGVAGSNTNGQGSGWSLTNVYVYNNRFFGEWPGLSAFFYSDGGITGTYIYNNVLSFDTTNNGGSGTWSVSPGMIGLLACSYVYIFNNTMSSDASTNYGNGALSGIVAYWHSDHIYITNNIISQPLFCENFDDPTATNIYSDYNFYNARVGYPNLAMRTNGTFTTLAQMQGFGYESNGIVAAPCFVHPPDGTIGSADFHLTANSPALFRGANLSAFFTTDINGNPRPASGPWDMGAYQCSQALGLQAPPPPSLSAPLALHVVTNFVPTVSTAPKNFGRVQFVGNYAASGSSLTASITPTAGNCLVAYAACGSVSTLSISDGSDAWNTQQNVSQTTGTPVTLNVSTALNVAGGPTIVNVSGSTGGNISLTVVEYSGVTGVDCSGSAIGTDFTSSVNLSTSANDMFVMAWATDWNNLHTSATLTPDAVAGNEIYYQGRQYADGWDWLNGSAGFSANAYTGTFVGWINGVTVLMALK